MLSQLSPKLNFKLVRQHARKLKVGHVVCSPCFKDSAEEGGGARQMYQAAGGADRGGHLFAAAKPSPSPRIEGAA
jgi:hypothetical protein